MTATDPQADWSAGQLRSARFGDVYFSASGGLGEARAVFLQGCGLPERWHGRRRFTVGELGFGTGLNILALLHLWRDHGPEGATLHIVSVEGFPLSHEDARAAHALWPELADLSQPLLAQWPTGARGIHRIGFPALGATLDLAVLDVEEALAGWTGRADAWFLDGFSPAKNPAMWSPEVLAAVARWSAPGARAATYSVAALVRQGLEAGGFSIARKPGYGHKHQRLEAALPSMACDDPPAPQVAIIGAGIAGAALARALADQGVEARVFAAGPMASGNPAALVSPRLAAGSAAGAALHAQAFRRAVRRIHETAPAAIIARGTLHLLRGAGETARGAATMNSCLFEPGSIRAADGPDALHFEDALVVAPELLRTAWLPRVDQTAVASLRHSQSGWSLLADTGEVVATADAVILAAGFASAALADIPLRPVRGQVSIAGIPLAGPPTSWGGYVIPTPSGLLFGATHGRGDADPEPREEDHVRNLEGLRKVRPLLAAALEGEPLLAAAGVRAATGDHQPIAGQLAQGLYTLTGLGGRGFTLAPLLAEHVAALVLGLPSPLPASLAALVEPARFVPGEAKRALPPDSPPTAAPAPA